MRTSKHNSTIERRRQRVASLRLRQLSHEEIADALQAEGFKASRPTVTRDMQIIEERWRESAVADIAAHKARQLAELAETKRQAWADGNLSALLRAIEIEVRILGTDEPIKIDWRREAEQLGIDAGELFNAMVGYVSEQAGD